MTTVTGLRTHDLGFPTSQSLYGSDAMNPDPDYSAAYVVLETDRDHEGHGLHLQSGAATKSVSRLFTLCEIASLGCTLIGLPRTWGAFGVM